jgi:hypothetical protein
MVGWWKKGLAANERGENRLQSESGGSVGVESRALRAKEKKGEINAFMRPSCVGGRFVHASLPLLSTGVSEGLAEGRREWLSRGGRPR